MIDVSRNKEYPEQILDISFPYCEEWVNEIKKLPHRRWDFNSKCWQIYTTELAALSNAVRPYNLSIKDPTILEYLPYDLKQIKANKIEKKQDQLKNVKPVVNYEFINKPMPHQIEAFNAGVASQSLLIADEQGLGKTFESINIARYRYLNKQIRKCLIVCCVNSVKYNWQEEIKTHAHMESMIFDQSTKQGKIDAIREWRNNDILFGIINIEAIRPSSLTKKEMYPLLSGRVSPFNLEMNEILEELDTFIDMVIVDEIHKCKNALSKQGVALRQIRARYKLALSGTPMTNTAIDLWNIMSFLGYERRNYWAYKNIYCIMGGYENKEIVGYKNLEDLNKRLSKCMLRRKKEEVLDLPPKTHMTEYVELTSKQKKLYKKIREGIIDEYITKMSDGSINLKKAVLNPLTLVLRLRQVTGGLLTSEKENIKLNRVVEILNEDIIPNGNKAVIFSEWEDETKMIREQLLGYYNPAYIVGSMKPEQRQEEVNRFQNDPKCKIAIGTIGAMGTGLTLTAGTYVIFMDKAWNQTDNEQAEDRCHRIGTSSNVTVISMVAKDSVDEVIESKLKSKENLFQQIVDGQSGYSTESNKQLLLDLLEVKE